MTLEPTRTAAGIANTAHPEVEFALVLARTIDAVQGDPEQLRQVIYELARQKLEQLQAGDPAEQQRLALALEVAIAGVEANAKGGPIVHDKIRSAAIPERSFRIAATVADKTSILAADNEYEFGGSSPVENVRGSRRMLMGQSQLLPALSLRHLAMFCFVAGVVVWAITFAGRTSLPTPQRPEPIQPKTELSVHNKSSQVPTVEKAIHESRLLPAAYGVYAEQGGKLLALQMLPGHAPDPRVAISAAITKPSETMLLDGNAHFIVFDKDGQGAHESVEVRVIAQVRQATNFDSSGKPVVAQKGGTWVIRNISVPYQTIPLQGNPQMYEIRSRESGKSLPAGRYALIVQGKSFEFSVAGPITDKRQCLESISAANGVFYTECPDT
ncbi:hypothetical protein [Bradyrhizobium sp. WSM471]|uniref:hypothetical protein n=1 Tax=Bradyrhizobium sp. WSM471 TaxID=319017 RepID=UPI00024D22E7|nr:MULTISPECIES: hypothetical protein [Bradyrhizobium]EHR01416.1 hypothetical protein Bra471DRAFT_02143 [Bradyrhizobium sp. WSM471]UFW43474.1 hypothetical protein BcanWSM471_10520 [Bradyrhizobium canariense]